MKPTFLARTLTRLSAWLRPAPLPSSPPTFLPPGERGRHAGSLDLLADLKGTAWTCASLNAAVCASYPPRLYVRTSSGQPAARCSTRSLSPAQQQVLTASQRSVGRRVAGERIEEVTDHPLLDLLAQVNPGMNAFDLWELTTLFQEIHGVAYWYVERDLLGVPRAIWPLPAHQVVPWRRADSSELVDGYIYRAGGQERRFAAADIIVFRYPDARDPYLGGLSPLRACFEQARLASEFAAFRQARFSNHAIPDALICPDQVMGEEERDRLERRWNDRLRRGGA
ncbi:MAG: phage portal protein, partial [Gemmataceae bacterium]